mmetsp:Transcript_11110/g.28022  ORF Transcript_11110/g.28022 Transcript_11110/m.28022 type:complete len:275 (+) Transcript_11110:1005-1829(+)
MDFFLFFSSTTTTTSLPMTAPLSPTCTGISDGAVLDCAVRRGARSYTLSTPVWFSAMFLNSLSFIFEKQCRLLRLWMPLWGLEHVQGKSPHEGHASGCGADPVSADAEERARPSQEDVPVRATESTDEVARARAELTFKEQEDDWPVLGGRCREGEDCCARRLAGGAVADVGRLPNAGGGDVAVLAGTIVLPLFRARPACCVGRRACSLRGSDRDTLDLAVRGDAGGDRLDSVSVDMSADADASDGRGDASGVLWCGSTPSGGSYVWWMPTRRE